MPARQRPALLNQAAGCHHGSAHTTTPCPVPSAPTPSETTECDQLFTQTHRRGCNLPGVSAPGRSRWGQIRVLYPSAGLSRIAHRATGRRRTRAAGNRCRRDRVVILGLALAARDHADPARTRLNFSRLNSAETSGGDNGKAPRRIWLVGLLVPYWSWRRSGDDRLRDIGHAVHFCRAGACPAAEVRASASVSAARRLAGAWFSGPECAPLHPAGVTDMFELIAYGCGLPPVRLHGTRARTEPAARQNGQHKKKARGRNPRSGRVCRQGLEPRTRGLRVCCSGVLVLPSTSIFTPARWQDARNPPRRKYRLLTAGTGWYRDVRANMEPTSIPEGLDHYQGESSPCPAGGLFAEEGAPGKPARVPGTVSNCRSVGGRGQRLTDPCRGDG
jgi:hypothetical protein